MDNDTWSDGDEESEITRDVAAASSGAITSGTNLTLTDVKPAMKKGRGCLKFNHVSAFIAAQLVEFQSHLELLTPREKVTQGGGGICNKIMGVRGVPGGVKGAERICTMYIL